MKDLLVHGIGCVVVLALIFGAAEQTAAQTIDFEAGGYTESEENKQ